MDHQNLEKMSSTALMLPRETEKVVILTPSNGSNGKILIREDTILANLQGCAGCGRAQFNCAGVTNQWSALCWGKKWDRRYYCLLVTLCATFVLSLIGTIMFCFTNTINNAVLSSMVIRNNSMAFRMWQRPTVKPLMKVHLFNYTNWEDLRNDPSIKLKVEDVGPYVYRQEVERVNIKFEGDKLSFQERNHFTYLPEKSTGVQYDQVNVPNLPLLGVMSKVMGLNTIQSYMVISTLNMALTTANHPDAFAKLPVHKFLWGYEDSIIDVAKPILSIQGQLNFDQFGLLSSKNGTVRDRLTINTGENDKDKMNIIEKYNGEPQLSFWGSNECNSIDASDGSIFPPSLLDREQVLNVFFPNLCRRLPFKYEKDVETEDGIQLLRYRMPLNVFDDTAHNPSNQCYCEMDSGACPPRGVINVTACAMGAPALVSFPHFYLGDEKLREDVIGLKPDPHKHDSFLDIHPTLGIALNGKSALQLNIQVKKTRNLGLSAVTYLPEDMILPVAWIDMSVEELPESIRSLVYHGTYSTAAVQLTLIATCVIALISSGVCLFVMFLRRRHKPCVTLKKVPVETEMRSQSS